MTGLFFYDPVAVRSLTSFNFSTLSASATAVLVHLDQSWLVKCTQTTGATQYQHVRICCIASVFEVFLEIF